MNRTHFVAYQVCYFSFFLCILQYSVFGSIMTIGGVIGGLVSGSIADLIDRRGVCFFCHLSICWYFWNYKTISLFLFLFFGVFLPVSCWNCNAGNVVLIFIQLCRLACHGIWKGFLFSYFPSIISEYSRSLVPWITEYFTDSTDFKASTFLNTLSY